MLSLAPCHFISPCNWQGGIHLPFLPEQGCGAAPANVHIDIQAAWAGLQSSISSSVHSICASSGLNDQVAAHPWHIGTVTQQCTLWRLLQVLCPHEQERNQHL